MTVFLFESYDTYTVCYCTYSTYLLGRSELYTKWYFKSWDNKVFTVSCFGYRRMIYTAPIVSSLVFIVDLISSFLKGEVKSRIF